MLVLREHAHLLDRLVSEDDREAVYRGAGHPGCQTLPEHAPPLRPPEMSDCVRNAPSVNLKMDGKANKIRFSNPGPKPQIIKRGGSDFGHRNNTIDTKVTYLNSSSD